jgi:transcriptional regulator with GAF, ATPase, and Fis domain
MIAGAGMKSLKEKVVEIEKEAIVNALREYNWVMSKAARKLGITERMIGYKMKKYGIKRSRMKDFNRFTEYEEET